MHYPEFFLENEMHKLLWDFEIQTDHLISARRPDLIRVKKNKKKQKKQPPPKKKKNKGERICRIVNFADPADPADHRIKLKESEKRDKYLDLAKEMKKKKQNN